MQHSLVRGARPSTSTGQTTGHSRDAVSKAATAMVPMYHSPHRHGMPWPPRHGSADQWISGGWRSHGGTEARREQSEETATGPGGQLARPVLLPVVLEPPWLPTGISTRVWFYEEKRHLP
jgi:hypothetical protein